MKQSTSLTHIIPVCSKGTLKKIKLKKINKTSSNGFRVILNSSTAQISGSTSVVSEQVVYKTIFSLKTKPDMAFTLFPI
jgi:hypothetical protein